jgi:hypothetical protein
MELPKNDPTKVGVRDEHKRVENYAEVIRPGSVDRFH